MGEAKNADLHPSGEPSGPQTGKFKPVAPESATIVQPRVPAPTDERISRKASLYFGLVTAIGATAGVLVVLLFAIFDHPYRAVVLLGSGTALMGVLRGIWPGRPWFASRKKALDVIAYVLAGAIILYLAPWTATMPVG